MTVMNKDKGLFNYKGALTLKINRRLIDKLAAKKLLNEPVASRLKGKLDRAPWAVLQYLLRRRLITLGRLLGDRLGVAYVNLEKTLFQPQVVRLLPAWFARSHQVVPIYRMGGTITVATCDPLNRELLQETARFLGMPVSPVFSLPDELKRAIDKHYPVVTPLRPEYGRLTTASPHSRVTQTDISHLLADLEKEAPTPAGDEKSTFVQALIDQGLVSVEDARRLVEKFGGDESAIMRHLARRSAVQPADVGRTWGDALGVAYVDLTKTLFQAGAVRRLPAEFARKNRMIPLYLFGDCLTVATCDPLNRKVIQGAEKIVGLRISPVFSLPAEIENAIRTQYPPANAQSPEEDARPGAGPREHVRLTQAEILGMVNKS